MHPAWQGYIVASMHEVQTFCEAMCACAGGFAWLAKECEVPESARDQLKELLADDDQRQETNLDFLQLCETRKAVADGIGLVAGYMREGPAPTSHSRDASAAQGDPLTWQRDGRAIDKRLDAIKGIVDWLADQANDHREGSEALLRDMPVPMPGGLAQEVVEAINSLAYGAAVGIREQIAEAKKLLWTVNTPAGGDDTDEGDGKKDDGTEAT